MTTRTKLICIGGPIHGKHVEIDPRANDYRCEVLGNGDTWELPLCRDPKPYFVNSTRHTYLRRCFSETFNIEALVHSSLTMHDALLKVFGYDH